MENHISYKDCFIRMQSFELMPRFTLTSADNGPLCRDLLGKAFVSKDEGDAFALEGAMHRIDAASGRGAPA
jgi:hypothetical protein